MPQRSWKGHRGEPADLSLEGAPGPLSKCASHMDEEVEKRRPLFCGHFRQKESPEAGTLAILGPPSQSCQQDPSLCLLQRGLRGKQKDRGVLLLILARGPNCGTAGTRAGDYKSPEQIPCVWRSSEMQLSIWDKGHLLHSLHSLKTYSAPTTYKPFCRHRGNKGEQDVVHPSRNSHTVERELILMFFTVKDLWGKINMALAKE